MYVPLVWSVDFINFCVFLFSKRITVFLIYVSLISCKSPSPFSLFLFFNQLCFHEYIVSNCSLVENSNSIVFSRALNSWAAAGRLLQPRRPFFRLVTKSMKRRPPAWKRVVWQPTRLKGRLHADSFVRTRLCGCKNCSFNCNERNWMWNFNCCCLKFSNKLHLKNMDLWSGRTRSCYTVQPDTYGAPFIANRKGNKVARKWLY